MAKPAGPVCNLNCTYCFYLEKESSLSTQSRWRMPREVLETYVKDYIASQDTPEVVFAWQGGEPTLMGLDFFKEVVELQQRHAKGRTVRNTLQTNGILLDDSWCEWLAQKDWLVGLSLDGPRDLHDTYRVDKGHHPTFDRVMKALETLKRHGTPFNTLTVVHRRNSLEPGRMFSFLKETGSRHWQFIPVVERVASQGAGLAAPPREDATEEVTPWSVRPADYGRFLIEIFERWVTHDVGRIQVQLFEAALANWLGAPADYCWFSKDCGGSLALEHNGDLYSCDHFVYPEYRLGNILETPMKEQVFSERQHAFGKAKSSTLPRQCRECSMQFACHGECPKRRFLTTQDGEPGLNYLCEGYLQFFNYIEPYMKVMVQLLHEGQPPARIMELIARHEQSIDWKAVGRNDPCPCGSGRKYKQCCRSRRLGA